MRKLAAILGMLFRRPPRPAKWETIGSRSYRKAIHDLRFRAASAIRRKAWGDQRSLYLRDPSHDLCSSRINGRFPDDWERYPTGYHVIHVIYSLNGIPLIIPREEWWRVPDEDVNADDWECRQFGRWLSAK